MNKSYRLPSSDGSLTDEDMGHNSSLRIGPKRGQQWLMDASKPELFSNKRKSVDSINNVNVSSQENTSSLQAVSGKVNRLSGSEPVRMVNPLAMNAPSLRIGNKNPMRRRDSEDHFKNKLSVGLSMPRDIESPFSSLNHSEFKKTKVNEVCDSENWIPVTVRQFSKRDNNTISMAPLYNKKDDSATPFVPASNHKDENTISVGPIFNKAGENLSSQGHLSNKGDGTFKLMGHSFIKVDNNILSLGQHFKKGKGNFISMDQTYGKEDGNVISMDCTHEKPRGNFFLMDPNYNQVNENFVSFGPSYNKEDEFSSSNKVDGHIRLMGQTYGKADTGIASNCAIYDKGVYIVPSMGPKFNKGEKGAVSFGGFYNEHEANYSENIIGSSNVLINQSSAQASEVIGQTDLVESNAGPSVQIGPDVGSKTNASAKNKKAMSSKPVPKHSFPTNVKIMLSTGIFDGVPVQYVSWKRDKSLRGVIEGAEYKCSCKECNYTKCLNAFEFENHAGFNTKHPNKNIYFANGKTVYAVAQELKNTPLEKLFDAIQTITNSPINQKNFSSWKESFQAATRELHRIYGKAEVTMTSENKDLASPEL